LRKHGRQDYIDKIFETHKTILNRYGELPYALESKNNLVKSVVRYSQKIQVLPDQFGLAF